MLLYCKAAGHIVRKNLIMSMEDVVRKADQAMYHNKLVRKINNLVVIGTYLCYIR